MPLADLLSDADEALASPPPAAPANDAAPSLHPMLADADAALSEKPETAPNALDSATPNAALNPVAAPGLSLVDALAAGSQGTSPVVRDIHGKYNYVPAGQDAQDYFMEAGHPQDTTTQVALRDPASGQYRVFLRNPENEESGAAGIGRVIASGMVPESTPLTPNMALTPSQSLLQDFERSGVTPNVPAVGQGVGAGLAANIGAKLPIMNMPIIAGAHRTIEDTAHAADRLAGLYGEAANPEQAGRIVQGGIEGFAKSPTPEGISAADIIALPTRDSSFASKSNALFDKLWSQIGPDTTVPLDNTLNALKGPMERFPSSPELGQLLTNPKLQSYYNALSTTGELTVPELKEFRSSIGRMIGEPALISDIPRADLKSVYAGMTQDLQSAAANESPQALSAFQRANEYYKAGISRIDQMEPLLKGTPEQAFNAINRAANPATGNAGLLRSLQRSMPAEDWGNVGSAVLRRMGEPAPGAKDVLQGVPFSPSSFATRWNKLTDTAKDTIFGPSSPGSNREALDALVRVAQAQKNVARYGNPSGTGAHAGAMGIAGLAAEHFVGIAEHPLATTMAVLGPYLGAKALMAPGFARWLYQAPSMVRSAPTTSAGVQRALGALDNLGRNSPILSETADRMRGAFASAIAQPDQKQ